MTVLRVQVFDLELGGGDYPPPVVGETASYSLTALRVGRSCHPDLASQLDVVVEPMGGPSAVLGVDRDGVPQVAGNLVLRAEGLAVRHTARAVTRLGAARLTVELAADHYQGAGGDGRENTGVIRRVRTCTWTSPPAPPGWYARGELTLADASSIRAVLRADPAPEDGGGWTRTPAVLVDLELDPPA